MDPETPSGHKPPAGKSISGDLPIRSARRIHPQDSLDTEEPQDPDVQAEGEPDAKEKPVPKKGSQTTRFEEDLSAAIGPAITAEHQPRKRNRNRRPKIKRGFGQPTGFEEWGAEGPLTPYEYKLDLSLYHPSKSFLDRLEEGLMRFDRKRRIEPWRRNIFHKYLQYGGITIGPNFGTGVPAKQLKDMTKDEAMQARTQTMIEKEREKLDISFDEVVRGFLGSYYIQYFNPEDEDSIKFTTRTISNFYTFLLFHNVCPEYTEDLLRARETCKLAETELWKNQQLVCKGPGSFNKACSMLFGGHYFECDATPDGWSQETFADGVLLTNELARKIVSHGIAGGCSHEIASRFLIQVQEKSLVAEKVEDIDGFEVISISEPERSCREFYRALAKDLNPVGVIKAKSFRDPSKPEIDLSPKERRAWDEGKAPSYEFDFLVESNVAQFFYPGVKILGSVWKLSCGAFFFDVIYSAYPAFWVNIANDMMIGWKHPRDLTKDKKDKDGEDEDEDDGEGKTSKAQLDEAVESAVKTALKATGHKVDENDKSATASKNNKNEMGNGKELEDYDSDRSEWGP